jgi:chemotaxis protein CheZ
MTSSTNQAVYLDVREPAGVTDRNQQEDMLARIGQLTRTLHDSLRELGLDAPLVRAAQAIPDTRDRLAYVAHMTEQAASRVLNATEVAVPLQEKIEAGASSMADRLRAAAAASASDSELRDLAQSAAALLDQVSSDAANTKVQLLDIMMAQDFQDLTGQVIKKITELAQGLEEQLVQLLVDYSPNQLKRDTESTLLNGPRSKLAPPTSSPIRVKSTTCWKASDSDGHRASPIYMYNAGLS